MTGSSPAGRVSRYPRASAPFSSPYSSSVIDFLSPDRNSEKSHKEALAAAAAHHERVRARADHVLYMHEKEQEQAMLVEQMRLETERLQIEQERQRLVKEHIEAENKRYAAEQARVAEERRLRDAAAKKVPPLSPIQVQAQVPKPPPAAAQPSTSTLAAAAEPTPLQQPKPAAQIKTNGAAAGASRPPASVQPVSVPNTAATSKPAPAPTPLPPNPKRDRALQIHKNLKELRQSISGVQSAQNPALKNRAGDLRRELRKAVGQLSFDKQNNAKINKKVVEVLKEGLANQVGSQLIDPSHFMFEQRQPVQGGNNDALPSLFLFLVNHLSKCVINQFINECSANTKTADPIGVLVAATFADPVFQWRGKPVIDIMIAKFYVVCPVLFGARGKENTEQGRERVGWSRRGEGGWIPEGEHYDRQMGLGAGFAAIALRDFSKSKKENPYPMSNYWEAMSNIVNTPPAEMSSTQCVVLRSMIDHYEQRILQFYGTAGVTSLRSALVDFPAAARSVGCKETAVEGLVVHGKTLKAKFGIALG